MNKAEWDKLDSREKDQLVWDCFPEIAPSSDDWVLSNDNGETGFDFFDTEAEAIQALKSYVRHTSLKDATVVHWRHCKNFTTDRNACALVMDEIEKRGLIIECANELDDEVDTNFIVDEWQELMAAAWKFLRADPDTLCYCAIKALE